MGKHVANAPVRVRLSRVVSDPHVPPKTFNRLFWTRAGSDFSLEFGHYDLAEFHAATTIARQKQSESGVADVELPVFISSRFAVTPENVLALLAVVSDMGRELVKEKIVEQKDVDQALAGEKSR